MEYIFEKNHNPQNFSKLKSQSKANNQNRKTNSNSISKRKESNKLEYSKNNKSILFELKTRPPIRGQYWRSKQTPDLSRKSNELINIKMDSKSEKQLINKILQWCNNSSENSNYADNFDGSYHLSHFVIQKDPREKYVNKLNFWPNEKIKKCKVKEKKQENLKELQKENKVLNNLNCKLQPKIQYCLDKIIKKVSKSQLKKEELVLSIGQYLEKNLNRTEEGVFGNLLQQGFSDSVQGPRFFVEYICF